MRNRIWSKVNAITIALTLMSGNILTYAVQAAPLDSSVQAADSADERFEQLKEEYMAAVPANQTSQSYTQNYQSNEPEPMTFKRGSGQANVDNGLTVTLESLTGNQATAVWDKAPWLSSGIVDLTFRYQSASQRIGFILKSDDDKPGGIAIKYDVRKIGNPEKASWVIQDPDNGSLWKEFEGPALEENQDYRLRYGFYQNHLIIAVDDTIIFDEETAVLSEEWVDSLGQIGLFKWYSTPASIKIISLNISGVGTAERPSTVKYNYAYNFEETEDPYQIDWRGDKGSGLTANIVADDTGTNHVLAVKSTQDQRTVDLSSPMITNGTLSFDYKLTRGSKFSFLFRVSEDFSKFGELCYDGTRWVAESNTGWTDTLAIPDPKEGKWNNMMINFQDKTLTVYLNKEYIGEFTFDKFPAEAGYWGLRLRNADLQIDNLRYTDEILIPEQVKQYVNDFRDNVPGQWNGNAVIVKEGTNKVLKLSGDTSYENEDSVLLTEGTYTAVLKSANEKLGLKIGDTKVYYNGIKWIADVDGTEFEFGGQILAPVENVWNQIGIQFTSSSLELSVNGKSELIQLSAAVIAGGKLGIIADSDIYIDNLMFSELFLDLNTETGGKMLYTEYYDTISNINYTGLQNTSISDGYLTGEIQVGGTAVNRDIIEVDNGVYQVKMNSEGNSAGVQTGNTYLYWLGGSDWILKVGSEPEIPFTGPELDEEDFIIRQEVIEKELTLYVNNKFIHKWDIPSYDKHGGFGIYNPGVSLLNISIDAIGAEEIHIYNQNYDGSYIPNWTTGSGSVEWNQEGGYLNVTAPGVAQLIDNDAPQIMGQKFEVDFTPNVDDSLDNGGRYGIFLKYVNAKDYVSIECDINGKWRVNASGSEYNFPVTYSMNKDETYHLSARLDGKSVSFQISSQEGTTDLGTVSADEISNNAGRFGVKSWYGTKTIRLDNLKIIEFSTLDWFHLKEKTIELTKEDFHVTLDSVFPRIISYELNGKQMMAQESQINSVLINGQSLIPSITGTQISENRYEYELDFPNESLIIKAGVEILENQVVLFEVTDIIENGNFKVYSFGLGDNTLLYTDSNTADSSYAWVASSGQWHGITEELADNTADMTKSGRQSTTMTMISSGGLAGSIENNVMSGGGRVILNKEIKPLVKKASVYNGVWTYRHEMALAGETEKLPWLKIVITEDRNGDQKVDWQDAAVAYREEIQVRPFKADETANNMMYIAFNFASQANDRFLNTLDTGKVLYNYTDGFGQMILHKGYQAEGHDDSIPSYSNIGVRQGGIDDFNYLINQGDRYNMKIGVHLNATEYHMDSNELYYDNLTNATAAGYENDQLAKGWDWIDTSYYVNQTKDVIGGQLKRRFEDLYHLTKSSANSEDRGLDFYYIDVYTGNDYNAYKLIEFANDLGLKVGTEFAGPLEPGVSFVHWGADLGYPNKGNGSILYRIVKNDQDLFVGNALFKGQKLPIVSYWGDSKMDIEQGVYVFNNEVLPTKYMQHFGVMKYEENEVIFSGGVTSTRNNITKNIELRKDGNLISSWKDTGTTTDENVRHSSEALSLIPWEWDNKTGESLSVSEGAKLYHWNPSGGTTTWALTDLFKDVPSFDIYELTQQGKIFVETLSTNNGNLTVYADKNKPYILYAHGVVVEDILPAAKNWGEGSLIKDFAFNSESIGQEGDVWQSEGNVTVEITEGKNRYSTEKELSVNRWNRFAQIGSGEGAIFQEIEGLEPGQDYTISVWANVTNGRHAELEAKIGDEIYKNYVSGMDGIHYSNFKYRNTTWQRIFIEFKVPEGVTEATVFLRANEGTGTVQFDDVKIWKHITTEEDVNNIGYAAYEDFENTSEGWGIFEYGGGNLQTHIASYQDNSNNRNEIAAAGSGLYGPVMTWVLDGHNSLKISEDTVGRLIKTSEAGLKLEPNSEYNLSFLYTMESNVRWKVEVKSRSTQRVVLSDTLSVFPNKGDMSDAKEYSRSFTTGDEKDYQVVFTSTYIAERQPKNTYTLILDNFAVEGDTEAALLKMIEEARLLEEGDYTPESWNVLKEALENAEAGLGEASNNEIRELLKALDKAIRKLERVVAGEHITAIEVTNKPDLRVYHIGDQLDTTGMVVKALWSNREKTEISSYELDYDFGMAGEQEVAVSYTTNLTVDGEEVTFEDRFMVEVLELEEEFFIRGIEIMNPPDKVVYQKNEAFNPDGMVVKALWSGDKIPTVINNQELEFEYDFTAAGESEVVIKYVTYQTENGTEMSLSAILPVTVKDNEKVIDSYSGAISKKKSIGKTAKVPSSTGNAENWRQDEGGWWLAEGSDGYAKNEWKSVNGSWYYFNDRGYMEKGWYLLDNHWYYLHGNGVMSVGWVLIDGKWYYFNSSGEMVTSEVVYNNRIYKFDSSGACINP